MSLDWPILLWIQNNLRCEALDTLAPWITALGDYGAVWILAGGLLLLSRRRRVYGIALLAGLLAGLLIGNLWLKNLFAQPRPCWIDSSVELLIAMPTDYAFPSGHTLSSVIGATVATMADRRFGWAAIPLALLISLSRLYLYVHFPSDLLAAAALGLALGLAAGSAAQFALRRREKTASP